MLPFFWKSNGEPICVIFGRPMSCVFLSNPRSATRFIALWCSGCGRKTMTSGELADLWCDTIATSPQKTCSFSYMRQRHGSWWSSEGPGDLWVFPGRPLREILRMSTSWLPTEVFACSFCMENSTGDVYTVNVFQKQLCYRKWFWFQPWPILGARRLMYFTNFTISAQRHMTGRCLVLHYS